jgi:hypothetical protein
MATKKEEKEILRSLILRVLERKPQGCFSEQLAEGVIEIGKREILEHEIELTPMRIGTLARYIPEVRVRRGQFFLQR